MKLGLDSYSYHLAFGAHEDFTASHPIDLFQFIDRVAALGLDGFQIDPQHIMRRDSVYLSEILACARNHNLFLEYGTIGIDVENLKNEIAICLKLESPVLRTFIGCNRYHPQTNMAFEVKKAVSQLNQVKQQAEATDIKIAIENHGDVSTDELLTIVKQVNSSHVGICLDLGNAMLTLEDPLEAAKKMAPYAFTTHFKDYAICLTNYGFKVTGAVFGEGNINLHRALEIIENNADLDKIILEIPVEAGADEKSSLEKEERIILKSVRYAREVLKIR